MPRDVKIFNEETPRPNHTDSSRSNNQRPWSTTPEPIKRLFNRFPLRTYPANELPQRKSPDRTQHNLYIFTTDDAAKLGLPSFNPGCLKWQVGRSDPRTNPLVCPMLNRIANHQVYLKFRGIPFYTVPSNNHASPTGALPFLLPSSSMPAANELSSAIPSTRLQRWIAKTTEHLNHNPDGEKPATAQEEPSGMRYEAYSSLLDRRIRSAWVKIPR